MMKANKQIGFININEESIDKIIQNGEVVFERGFLREKTSTTLPITFGGVGKDLKDYRVYGNTYQKTTLGINKLENKIKAGRYASGITFTYDEDGTYTFSGQNTTNSNATVYLFQNDSFFLPKGTYYYIPTGNSSVTITLQYLDGTTTRYLDMSTSGSFTINSDITFQHCYIQVRKNTATVFENYKVYPMLSTTPITIDDYEPYTNGSKPNPIFPSQIVSLGAKTKNLFDKNTANVLNAYFEYSGDTIKSVSNNKVIYLKCNPNTSYTITQGTSTLSSHIFQIATTNEEPALEVNVYNFVELWYSKNYVYTTDSTAKYILIRMRTADYIDEFLSTIQVEEGNTATEYEPYGYKIPINVRSENLFDKDNDIQLGKTATFTGEEDNEFTVSSSSSRTVVIVKVPSNEYVSIAINNDVYKGTRFFVSYLKTKSMEAGKTENQWFSNSATILTPNNANYIGLVLEVKKNGTNQTSTQELINDIGLVITTGSTVPNKYIPYYNETTNIYLDEPLRKSNDGTYKDYIDFKNQKIYRQIKETVLTGNENWGRIGANNNGNRFRTAISDLAIGAEKILHCTHFKNDGDTWSHQGISGSSGTMLYIRWDELFETVEDLTTWLSSNTPIVDYVLATPTEESITLPNIPTVDGNNTLNIETEITPSQVYIKYKSNN